MDFRKEFPKPDGMRLDIGDIAAVISLGVCRGRLAALGSVRYPTADDRGHRESDDPAGLGYGGLVRSAPPTLADRYRQAHANVPLQTAIGLNWWVISMVIRVGNEAEAQTSCEKQRKAEAKASC